MIQTKQISRVALLAALVWVVVGCGVPWRTVQRSGPPSALAQVAAVDVVFDWSRADFGGRSLDAFRAERSGKDRRAVDDAVAAVEGGFVEFYASQAGIAVRKADPNSAGRAPGAAVLYVRPLVVQFGKYAFVYAQNSLLTTQLEWRMGGQPTDIIETRVRVVANITRPAIVQRMRKAGAVTGQRAARFFQMARGR